jgi:hypothetical protein
MKRQSARMDTTAVLATVAILALGGTTSAQSCVPVRPSPQNSLAPLPSPQACPGPIPCPTSPTCGNPYNPSVCHASLDDLVRLTPAQLDCLYQQSPPAALPQGNLRGRALVAPGTKLAPVASGAAKVLWQGKVIDCQNSMAVNRFFGIKMIRGNLYYDSSWLDGRPALILDYSETSLVYAHYRDEIREVAPGLYLGLMYDRTKCPPKLKMYFALQANCCD